MPLPKRPHIIGYRKNGAPIWSVAGAADPPDKGDDNGGGDGGGDGKKADDKGTGNDDGGGDDDKSHRPDDEDFPSDKTLAEMTVEEQRNYWKAYARRNAKRVKETSDYEDVKRRADDGDKLRKQHQTDQEKAIDEAREAAKAEARGEFGAKLVDAHIIGLIGDRLTEQQRETVLDGLDRSRYLTKSGDVDTDKVKQFVDTIAPKSQENGAPSGQSGFRHGQGKRGGGGKPSVSDGMALYAEKYGKQAS